MFEHIRKLVADIISQEKGFKEIATVLGPLSEESERMVKLTKVNASVYRDGLREHFIMLIKNQILYGKDFYHSLSEAHREMSKIIKTKRNMDEGKSN